LAYVDLKPTTIPVGSNGYPKKASILSKALFIISSDTQKDNLKCPSPEGPKAIPGVVETLASFNNLMQKDVESSPSGDKILGNIKYEPPGF
jgi:hypothetical protein